MAVSPLFGLSGRVERIPEQDDAGERLRGIGRQVGGDPPSHRFTADEETTSGALDFVPNSLHDCPVAGLEHRPAIRDMPPPFGVLKV
jgi:hypothetical protein